MPADGIRWFHVWSSKLLSIFVPPFHDNFDCFITMPSHGKFERPDVMVLLMDFRNFGICVVVMGYPMGLDGFLVGTRKKPDELETLIRH